jgi:hypothetical protein
MDRPSGLCCTLRSDSRTLVDPIEVCVNLVRNLAVALFGAATSVLTAVVLVFLEARTGESLFGYAPWAYVPVGALGAGFLGAIGYLLGSVALRTRPTRILLPGVVLIAAATAYLAESAEFGLFLSGPAHVAGVTANLGSYTSFLGDSLIHSQLHFGSAGSGGSASSSSSGPMMPQIGIDAGGTKAEGIGQGVQNMLASQDMSGTIGSSTKMAQINKISDGIESFGSDVEMHGAQIGLLAVQTAVFSIGAFVVFAMLRRFTHCVDCGLLLGEKGVQTRYYTREHEMRGSVDELLTMARKRQLRESIQAHFGKGKDKRSRFSAFSSTIEIWRCPQCETHWLNFKAQRKKGAAWKDIAIQGFSASSMDPIDVTRA